MQTNAEVPADRRVTVRDTTYRSVGPAWGIGRTDEEWVPLADLTRDSLENVAHELLDALARAVRPRPVKTSPPHTEECVAGEPWAWAGCPICGDDDDE